MKTISIFGDTNTLPANVNGNRLAELQALTRLRELEQAGKCKLFWSPILEGEVIRTSDTKQREQLSDEYKSRHRTLHNEKLLGFSIQDSPRTFIACPMMSDVQDEKAFAEIHDELKRRLPREARRRPAALQNDAKLLAQAIFNGCEIFMTLDDGTIIKPMRRWLEQRFAPLRVLSPSEAVIYVESAWAPKTQAATV